MSRGVGGACGGGYSKTVVGLIDRGWSGGGSFGTCKAVEVAVVSGEAAMVASTMVVLFRVARPFVGVGLGVCCDR